MAIQKSPWFLVAFFITFTCASQAKTFEVGGKDGWTLNPSESYNNWSSRLRFLINDTLHFKYGGSDSVLVVNKGDYDGCNANNPIMKLEGGDSVFKFDRSGPFYFITGNKSNCDQGQKLIVVVLALRNRSPPPSATTPSTLPPSPTVSPVLPPSPAVTPVLQPSPSPSTISPVLPPSSASPVSPPSPSVSPESSPSGTPSLTPESSSGGGSATSPGGGSSTADGNTPPPSAATPPLSATIIESVMTMIFALWLISY